MKRTYMIALALLLLAAILNPTTVQAEEPLTSGDYKYRILEDGTAEITRCSDWSATFLEIPGSLDGLVVTSIGDEAFFDHTDHLDITIPDSVTSIKNLAFFGCENLMSIILPNNVTSIGNNPFAGCARLNQIVVRPDHPTLATIDGVLFSKADKRLVWYPMAREDTTYEVPQGILMIGDYAFCRCESLGSIILPNSVTSIGNEAFIWCENLTDITLPDSVTSVGNEAFTSCKSLMSITIPNSVTNMGDNPFTYCENLNQVVVRPDHPALGTIDGVLFSKADKRLVWYPMAREGTVYEVPQGILIIGDGAFERCPRLTDIILPNSITNIGDRAFFWCENLRSITFPDSVTSIGNRAFDMCNSLNKIIIAPDSYAQKYCEERNLPFVYQENTDWLNE